MHFSILPLLGLLFVALKLTGTIAWSWWLVLMPFYFGFALLLALAIIGAIGFAMVEFSKS